MLKTTNRIKRNLGLLALAGATAIIGCSPSDRPADNEYKIKMAQPIGVKTYVGHASIQILTDVDLDGKFDVLEYGVGGSSNYSRFTFKEGYGPARSWGGFENSPEIEIVGEEFFRRYDEHSKEGNWE